MPSIMTSSGVRPVSATCSAIALVRFYLFNLEKRIPARHLLRRINPIVTRVLADLREKLKPFYSEAGRPSIDPELMLRMLILGYCYGIRFERKLCEEVELHLAYRWFCCLALDDKVPITRRSRSIATAAPVTAISFESSLRRWSCCHYRRRGNASAHL
jgi:transposase